MTTFIAFSVKQKLFLNHKRTHDREATRAENREQKKILTKPSNITLNKNLSMVMQKA